MHLKHAFLTFTQMVYQRSESKNLGQTRAFDPRAIRNKRRDYLPPAAANRFETSGQFTMFQNEAM